MTNVVTLFWITLKMRRLYDGQRLYFWEKRKDLNESVYLMANLSRGEKTCVTDERLDTILLLLLQVIRRLHVGSNWQEQSCLTMRSLH
jgi:hypothetical protein